MPKPKRIKIGDWVRVRKVGITGVYQVVGWNEDGTVIVEQDEGGKIPMVLSRKLWVESKSSHSFLNLLYLYI